MSLHLFIRWGCCHLIWRSTIRRQWFPRDVVGVSLCWGSSRDCAWITGAVAVAVVDGFFCAPTHWLQMSCLVAGSALEIFVALCSWMSMSLASVAHAVSAWTRLLFSALFVCVCMRRSHSWFSERFAGLFLSCWLWTQNYSRYPVLWPISVDLHK